MAVILPALLLVGAVAFRVDMSGKNEKGEANVTTTESGDVVDVDLPTSYSAWRERGNAHVRSTEFSAALRCYRAALSDTGLAEARREIAVLLSNRALCRYRIGDFGAAVTFAGAALQLDRNNTNAAIRLKNAWSRLAEERQPPDGREGPAAWCRCAGVALWEERENIDVESDATALKDHGKLAFDAGLFGEADKLYASAKARHASLQDIVVALTNAAACCIEMKDFATALEVSTAAVVLDQSNAKAWVRRSKALEGMQDRLVDASLDGVPLQPVRMEAKLLKERLSRQARLQKASEKTYALIKRLYDKTSSDPARFFVEMLAMLSASGRQAFRQKYGPLFDRTVPKFHEDFPRERGWPTTDAGLSELYREHLKRAHDIAMTHPWLLEHEFKTGEFEPNNEDLLHRFQGTAGLQWFIKHRKNLELGGIIRATEDMDGKPRYSTHTRSNFGNNAPAPESLHRGTVHVAVGFNDLNMLLACRLLDAPTGKSGPLRFIGIDMSAFSVAKALVVADMFRRESVPLLHCMQVWFSASWSTSALASFTWATRAVLSQGQDSQVKAYLNHWLSSRPVRLLEARARWLAARKEPHCCRTASMKQHADRMALSEYALTGDLGVGADDETPAVGSLTMFSVPDGAPIGVYDESAFNAVLLKDLAAARKQRGFDIVTALREILLERFALLRRWLVTGAVTIDLRCGELALENVALHREVADMRPWTMSWSNVLDYMLPTDFHALARACSVHGDTIHYGYSMNWPSLVYGSSIMDYVGREGDLSPGAIIQKTHLMLHKYGQLKPAVGELIVLPPFGTPVNTAAYFLATTFYEKWVNHFFGAAKLQGPVQVAKVELSEFNPLAQTDLSVTLTWTYDPEIRVSFN